MNENEVTIQISKKLLDFKNAINPLSFSFLNPKIEDEFHKYKLVNYNLIQIILFFCLIFYIFSGIKPLQIYLLPKFDFEYLGMFQDAKSFLTAAIRIFIYIILEIIIYFLPKFKIIKGLLICFSISFELLYASYNFNINLKTNSFHCVFFTIPTFLNAASISIIYCHNCMIGCINFLIICLTGIVFISISPFLLFDRIVYIINLICVGIIIALLIRYIDFILRQSFYFMRTAIQEKDNTNKILETLPEPIIIEEKGQIIFGNDAFQNIKTLNNSEESMEGNRNQSISNFNEPKTNTIDLLNQISELIINKEKQKSIKDYIKSSEQILSPTLFDYVDNTNKKETTFEIISKEVQSQNQTQIVYLLKNMTYYKKFKKGKSKTKYSRLFIASVTHNFRTPLNMILGNSELLRDKVVEPEILELANNIITGSNMLNILIEDLIDYSNLLTGVFQPKIRPFNINGLMNQMRDLLIGKFHDKSLLLEFLIASEVPQMINSDERRIMQIITHLLENALKFTMQGSVKVNVDSLEASNKIKISVTDTGIGIKSEDLPKLFKSYGKLEDANNLNPNGIGMVLYICKKIATKLLGSMNIVSTFGEGSIFSLEFTNQENLQSIHSNENSPSRRPSYIKAATIHKIEFNDLNEEEKRKGLEESNLNLIPSDKTERMQIMECVCPKILIVDDEHTNRFVLSQMCLKGKLRFEEAKNGQEAFDCVQNFKNKYNCCKSYKMILMDSNMPVMNGEESTLAIRSYLESQNIPPPKIICITANSSIEQLVKEYHKYIYDKIISKPVSYDIFRQEIGYIW